MPDATRATPSASWPMIGGQTGRALGDRRQAGGAQGSERHRLRPDGHGLIVTDEGSHVHPIPLEPEERKLCLGRSGRQLLRAGEEADLEGPVLRRRGSSTLSAPTRSAARFPITSRLAIMSTDLRFERRQPGGSATLARAGAAARERTACSAGTTCKRLNATSGGSISRASPSADGRLLFGLRSPSLDGQAFVLSVAIEAFSGTSPSRQQRLERYRPPLGEGAGSATSRPSRKACWSSAAPRPTRTSARSTLWLWSDDRKLERLGRVCEPRQGQGRGSAGPGRRTTEAQCCSILFDGVGARRPAPVRAAAPAGPMQAAARKPLV